MSQQMRNCVCETQTATTSTRPPLVASQYTLQKKNKNGKYCYRLSFRQRGSRSAKPKFIHTFKDWILALHK